ncbi:hypothetical protein ACR6C2_05450 [Streptomyces sp. INA 01156]
MRTNSFSVTSWSKFSLVSSTVLLMVFPLPGVGASRPHNTADRVTYSAPLPMWPPCTPPTRLTP